MQKSSKFLAAAALAGLGAILAGLTSVSDGSARAVDNPATDIAAERIAAAFAVAPAAAAAPAQKGDLLATVGCAGQKWPEIASACLVKADGLAPLPVRTVTIGTQVGHATTVLARVPAPQVASR